MLMDHNDKGEKRKGNQDFFTAEDTGAQRKKCYTKEWTIAAISTL